jgi:hypothetical protein
MPSTSVDDRHSRSVNDSDPAGRSRSVHNGSSGPRVNLLHRIERVNMRRAGRVFLRDLRNVTCQALAIR